MNGKNFSPVDANIELVDELYCGGVAQYMNMAGAQFLRDFRQETKLKKTEAHRKKDSCQISSARVKGCQGFCGRSFSRSI